MGTLSKPSTSTRLAPAARTTFLASATTLKSRTSTTPISNNTHRIILGKQSLFHTQTRNMASATSFYDFKPLDKKGSPVPLSTYANKVVLIVNTASKCASHHNTKVSKKSTNPSTPRTRTNSSSSASPATNSAPKNPAPTTRSRNSAS